STVDQIEVVDREGYLAVAADLVRLKFFERRVRAVAGDAFGVIEADAEDEVVRWPIRAHLELHVHALTRLKDVRRLPASVLQRHAGNLDLRSEEHTSELQ